jgi:hypothetical protein
VVRVSKFLVYFLVLVELELQYYHNNNNMSASSWDELHSWEDSDEEKYKFWEPCYPNTSLGWLASAGWFGAETPSCLERCRIAILIAVRNSFLVPVVEIGQGLVLGIVMVELRSLGCTCFVGIVIALILW